MCRAAAVVQALELVVVGAVVADRCRARLLALPVALISAAAAAVLRRLALAERVARQALLAQRPQQLRMARAVAVAVKTLLAEPERAVLSSCTTSPHLRPSRLNVSFRHS
jgi:hypothetical protein